MRKNENVQVLLLRAINKTVKGILSLNLVFVLFLGFLVTACTTDPPSETSDDTTIEAVEEPENKCPNGNEANIYESSSAILVNSTTAQEGEFKLATTAEETTRYWGTKEKEKRFTVPFWKADQLLGDSTGSRLALRVVNIDNNELVDAQWVAFNEDAVAELCDDANVSYYVIERQRFPDASNFKSYVGSDYRLMVVARIGKNENNEISVYFIVASHNFVTVSNCQDCPDGATTGVKVP